MTASAAAPYGRRHPSGPAAALRVSALACAFCVLALPARAQEPPPPPPSLPSGPLTLVEAIRIGQEHGLAARAALDTRDAARARNRAFGARLLPQLSLSGQAMNLNRGITPLLTPTGETKLVTQAQNQSSMGLSLSQAIPWTGGRLTMSSQLARIDNFGTGTTAATPRVWTTTPFTVGVRQDLFRPRTLRWDQHEQALTYTLAERQYLEAREDAAAGVAAAFFDYDAAQVTLQNATGNAAVSDTLFTLNKGRYTVGRIGENDVLQSELALLNARSSLDAAKVERDRAEAALRRLLQLPPGDTLRIVNPDVTAEFPVDPDVAVAQALANSSTVEQVKLEDVQARRRATEASLANRPNATIAAVAGFNQSASLLGEAYKSPLGTQQLSVGISMPLIQWGAGSADAQAARLEVQRAATSGAARRDQLREDARFAALQFVQSRRNLALAAKADTVAGKRFEVAKARYVIGKIGMSDLYIGLNEKNQAVQSYVQALRQYWSSYFRLRRVTLYDFEKAQPIE